MFKPIKSPVGEVVSDEAYSKGVEYLDEYDAQYWFRRHLEYAKSALPRRPIFADWLEAQGVRLV